MHLATSSFSRKTTISAVLAHEEHPNLSRKQSTLLAGDGAARTIKVGTLLAAVMVTTALSVAAVVGGENGGDGTIAMDESPVTSSVSPGVYTITCIEPGTDGVAKFSVEKPDGTALKSATSGTAYAQHIKFTISAGATPFDAGDQFTVSVSDTDGVPSGKVVDWDPNDATKSKLCGVSLCHAEAPDSEDLVDGVKYLRRLGVIKTLGIEWPAGVSDAQKAAALTFLDDELVIASA